MLFQVMRIVRLSVIALFIMISAYSMSFAQGENAATQKIPESVNDQLDSYIKKYINTYARNHCEMPPESTCRGSEYKEARKFCFGDINGDGREDIAVLYTIESLCCGNNYHFFLAVFIKEGAEYKYVTSKEVGGKGVREVMFNTIKGRQILLDTKEYLPDDPMCCPSGKGRTTYILRKGKLLERNRIGVKPMSSIERFRRGSERLKPLIDQHLKNVETEKRNAD